MGSLLSRFKKDKSSLELLETLQEEIETIECDKHTTVLKQKKYVGKLILYSVCIYLFCALTVYFLAFPSTLRDGALYAAPLVLIPVIVFAAQRCIKWYFSRKITWNTEKLADLRARKKKILDEVMDKETFRVAREILEKFAPDQLRKSEGKPPLKLGSPSKTSPTKRLEQTTDDSKKEEKKEIKTDEFVRRPSEVQLSHSAIENPRVALPYQIQAHNMQSTPLLPQTATHVLTPSQKRRLARPILDPVGSRGFIDRLIEHLVGDGPANRYALICSHCSSHNGMALKEEFEYISFRCAYCGFPNPSRKVMSKRNSSASVQEAVQTEESINGDKNEEISEAELSAESNEEVAKEELGDLTEEISGITEDENNDKESTSELVK